MSLTFYFHPLSSFCQKALVALYENDGALERVGRTSSVVPLPRQAHPAISGLNP